MRRFLSLFTMLMLCGVLAFAQSRVVTGKVIDNNGKPVPFASVLVKGATVGVQTNVDGEYSIRVNKGDVLQISQLNYGAVDVPVGSLAQLTTSLELKANTIKEVIVTSAFNLKRTARSTSANAQVLGSEQLNPVRSTSVNDALAGKISGIQVRSQSAGALGRQNDIRLRGENDFGDGSSGSTGSSVIYVVDGTILPNANDVNMDDIDDITVLQGPAAAAIFGAQGANGAIVMNLKKGRKSPGMGIEINSGVQFDKVYILPNHQNSYAGGDGENMSLYKWKAGDPEGWKALDGKYYPDYSEDVSWGPRMVGQEYIPWYAWYGGHERAFKTAALTPQPHNSRDYFNTQQQINNNINFSKVTDIINLRASYGNIDVKGLLPTTGLKKNTFNLNTSINLSNKLTLGVNFNYISTSINGEFDDTYANSTSGSFNQWFHRDLDMNIMRELKDLKTPSGVQASWNHQNPNTYNAANPTAFYGAYYWVSPYVWFDLVKNTTRNDRLYGNVSLAYKFSNDFGITGTYRKQQNTVFSEERYSSDLFNNTNKVAGGNCTKCFGYYSSNNSFSNIENFQVIADYNKKIKNFSIAANAGIDISQSTQRSNFANTNGGLSVNNLYTIGNSKTQATIGNNRVNGKSRALFLTATFGYKNLLFVDGTIRKDYFSSLTSGSEDFVGSPDILSKSIGASFVFSDLIGANKILSFGKIRAAYGEVPQSITTYRNNLSYDVSQFQWAGNIVQVAPNTLIDPNLRGAVAKLSEIGIETRFLKSRLGITATYYEGTSKNFPTTVTLPATSGVTGFLTNLGEIKKKGIDMQFMLKPIWGKDFKWEITATYAYLLKNTVVDLDGNDTLHTRTAIIETLWGAGSPALVQEEGQQWGQIWGNGIMRNAAGIPILDASGNYSTDPNVNYGSVLPKYTGGIQNSFSYKNFTMNVNIDYQSGGKYFSLSDMWGSFTGLTARTAVLNDKGNPIRDPVADGGGVHVFGVDATDKAVDYYVEARSYYNNLYSNKLYDEFVYDLTFVKLREFSLGYNIPVEKLGLNKWVNRANFAIVARNPWLIYAKTKDFDPSQISAVSGEGGGFPATRSIGFNLKVGF